MLFKYKLYLKIHIFENCYFIEYAKPNKFTKYYNTTKVLKLITLTLANIKNISFYDLHV